MIKLPRLAIKTLWKEQTALEEILTWQDEKQIGFCPHTIILGALNSTEAGYKPPTSIPTDYTSFSKIFTGREAIIAVWDHSFTLLQLDPNDPDNTSYVKYNGRGGDVFYGNVVTDDIGIQYTASSANNSAIEEQAVKNVVMNVPNNEKNYDFINNLNTNVYKLFMLPEINSSKSGTGFNVDRQWYYIEVISKIRDPKTKKIAIVQITFVSLNDKLATSELAINEYVQLGAPGERVATPALDAEGFITYDPYYMRPRPVTHAQVSIYGSAGVVALAFWGHDMDNTNPQNLAFRQYPTKLLFPWRFQASTYDPVSTQALPEQNYFVTVDGESILKSFQNWKDTFAQLYDQQATKCYEGFFQSKGSKTKATNTLDSTNTYLPYFDDAFLNGKTLDNNPIKPTGNPYLQYYNSTNKTLIGQKDNNPFTFDSIYLKNLTQWNFWQYIMLNSVTEIPLSSQETTKIAYRSIPLFGTFYNIFTGGLNDGFKTTTNANIPKFPFINMLYSCELYNFYTSALWGKNPPNPNLIPYDVFRNGTPDEIGAILGAPSHMTSFTFSLTDELQNLGYWNINTGVFSYSLTNAKTVDIGQFNNETSTPENVGLIRYTNTPSLNTQLIAPDLTDNSIAKYAIDMIDLKIQGKCNYKVTFYSMPGDRNQAVSDEYAIWASTSQTIGKASNNIRLIANTTVVANNTWKFDVPFRYPQAITPPPPTAIVAPIFIDISDKIINSNGNVYIDNSLPDIPPPRSADGRGYYKWIPFDFSGENRIASIEINLYSKGYQNLASFLADYKQIEINLSGFISDQSTIFITEDSTFAPVRNDLQINQGITIQTSDILTSIGNSSNFFDNSIYLSDGLPINDVSFNSNYSLTMASGMVTGYTFSLNNLAGNSYKKIIIDNNSSPSSTKKGFINSNLTAFVSYDSTINFLYVGFQINTQQAVMNIPIGTQSLHQYESRTAHLATKNDPSLYCYSNWNIQGQNIQFIPN